jgi:hypothetical protein
VAYLSLSRLQSGWFGGGARIGAAVVLLLSCGVAGWVKGLTRCV